MRSVLVSIGCLLFAASTAHAQSADEQSRKRVGLELGVGLQAGEIACTSQGDFCDDFTKAGGLNLAASYFFSPAFGITLDLWAMTHREDDFTLTHYVNTVGIKWRPVRILTLTAGVGAAHATLKYDGLFEASTTSDDAFAVMGAASLDLIRGRHFALSVEARFGTGFYGDSNDNDNPDVVARNTGLGVGFTFFNL